MKKISSSDISLAVVSGIRQCEKIWNTFSRQDSVWDSWQFRKTIIEIYKHKLHFVVARRDSKITAAMPLWWNESTNQFEWISEGWTEGNYAFGTDSEAISEIRKFLKKQVVLEAVKPEDAHNLGGHAAPEADHFGVDLASVGGTWEGYLEQLPAKKRQTIKRDIRLLESRNPTVSYDGDGDLEIMFDLNIARMREKANKYDDEELSTYEQNAADREFIRKVWDTRGGEYQARTICVRIDGKPVSCDFNLIYKDKYYSLHGGVDIHQATGIGSLSNKLIFQDAMDHGCTYIDFCMEDHHWKRSWFKPDPMYKVVWNIKPRTSVTVIYSSVSPNKISETASVADDDTRDSAGQVSETAGNMGYDSRAVDVLPDQVDRVHKIPGDVIFNMCDWSGKDAHLGIRVLEKLENSERIYTGGNRANYIWGSDKIAMKKLFDRFGIPSPAWGYYDKQKLKISKVIKFPVILKPAWEHCSIGLTEQSVAGSMQDLRYKADQMWQSYREPVLVEEFIDGNEYQVVVLEKNGRPWVLPPVETVFKALKGKLSIITFEDNWLSDDAGGKIQHIGPADPSSSLTKKLVEIGKKSFTQLGCRGYIRLDIRENGGRPYVLEVNVNPGIGWDKDEDIRVAAEAAGLTLEDVVSTIIDSALSAPQKNLIYDPAAF